MSTKLDAFPVKSSSESTSPNTKHTKPKRCFSFLCHALPLFHPYGPIRLCWDAFIMMALIYTAIEIPLTLAFEITLSLTNTLGIMAFCIDILLLIDICINFRTEYYDKWDRLLLHTDPYDVAKKYVKTWFWLDLLTSFPVEFIINVQGAKDSNFTTYIKVLRVFRLFRILKMLRVIRVIKMFDGLTKMMDIAREMFFIIRLWKILGGMILTAHYFACIWWHVGLSGYKNDIEPYTNEDGVTSYSSWIQAQGIEIDDPLLVQYSASWYWAVVTLFTTGYGDITAHNPTEMWVCSICILTGSCLFAYFIGTLTTWVAEGDRVRGFEMQKVEEAQAFCRHHKFNRDLTRTILTHVRYYCNYNFVFETEEILPLLPPFLQREVNQSIAERSLSNVDLFKDLPREIIGEIALTMYSISCNAERYLFNRGDVAKCMYLQRTGEARLRYFDDTPSRKLKRGDVIGERSLIAGKRRYDVICLRWSEFFVLHVDNIKDIFRRSFKPKRFKHEWNLIKKKVKMSDTKYIKSQRRCNLANHASESVSRQVVHELSVRGKTLRSEFIEKFMRSPKKTVGKQSENKGYQIVAQSDENIEIHKPAHTYVQSSVLDMDDIQSIDETNETRPRAKTFSVISKSNYSPTSQTSNNETVPKFQKRGGSSSFFNMPWIARHNSEKRNEKVKTHTEQTAYGKKCDPPSTNIFQFNNNNNSDEELDLDFSDDSDDLLASLTANSGTKRRGAGSVNVRKGLGKFGHNKKRNISTKRIKTQLPIMASSTRRIKSLPLETVEDTKSSDTENENETKEIDRNKKSEKSANKLLEISKIAKDKIRNCSYEKINKGSGSYEMTQSGSSGTDIQLDDENAKNKKTDSK